jgi:hypothetical protein
MTYSGEMGDIFVLFHSIHQKGTDSMSQPFLLGFILC